MIRFISPSGCVFSLVLFSGSLPKQKTAFSYVQESCLPGPGDLEPIEPHRVVFAPGVTLVPQAVQFFPVSSLVYDWILLSLRLKYFAYNLTSAVLWELMERLLWERAATFS